MLWKLPNSRCTSLKGDADNYGKQFHLHTTEDMAKVFIHIRTRDQSSTISVDGFSRYYVDSWSHTSVKLDLDSSEPGVGVLLLSLPCKIMTQSIRLYMLATN